MSKVVIPAPAGTSFWQLVLWKSYAYVTAPSWGSGGAVVKLEISRDVPVALSTEPVGHFAYEFGIWAYPTSRTQCESDGWTRFGIFDNRGACIRSVVK